MQSVSQTCSAVCDASCWNGVTLSNDYFLQQPLQRNQESIERFNCLMTTNCSLTSCLNHCERCYIGQC